MKNLFIATILLFCLQNLNSQVPVYNNFDLGNPSNPDVGLVTSLGSGAGGADESVVQNASLGMTALGRNVSTSFPTSLAEDFTLSTTTDISSMTFYAYQTNAPSTPSSLSAVYVRIWDGQPNMGGNIIWGDLSTNLIEAADFSNIYRVSENTMGNSQRAINTIEANIDTTLSAGSYWVEWAITGSASFSGPWAPPITIIGNTSTGNALSFILGAWENFNDGGTLTPQGLPFVIFGVQQAIPTLNQWGLIVLALLLLIVGVVGLTIRTKQGIITTSIE